ncbi:MAG: transglutaminase domain-containing protein [Planctomycetes bacterium]|nr:transglutaminase domain-containing protein [Planctomycetota bacterium]
MTEEFEKGVPEWAQHEDPRKHCYTSYTDRSIERIQLEEAIAATEQNVDYLYGDFTPVEVDYPRSTRPLLELIVDKVCRDCETAREKATALVTWRRLNHTHLGKCGLGSEEEIILGGYSMCHDAARTMTILAQVAGLGSRLVIALNNEEKRGHTLSEVYVDGKWALFDPSPMLAWGYLEMPDGELASAWDVRQNPDLVSECPTTAGDWERNEKMILTAEKYGSLFPDYELTNYSLEDSTRFMALRFLRYVTAHKALDNYDYRGHMANDPIASFLDLDQSLEEWVEASIENMKKT